MDSAQIVTALHEIAVAGWSRSPPMPTYLSLLPRLLQDRLNGDYKDALAGETLKAFIERTENQKQYRLLAHPTQRAKLAIIPFEAEFNFDNAISEFSPQVLNSADVASFAKLLNTLSPQTLADWDIPATVVLKLISSK
jgi:hypothetical protein